LTRLPVQDHVGKNVAMGWKGLWSKVH